MIPRAKFMPASERIPTNIRNLLILEALAASNEPMTSTELGKALKLPKPTIHRLVATLLNEGFLARDPNAKGVRPGRRVREMANGLIHNSTDATIRRQILNWVAAEVQETVNFASPTEDGMTYLDRVETDWAFRIQLPIGVTVPFHRTASGKTYLASMPPARRVKTAHAMDLSSGPPKAHATVDELLADLKEVAKRGYAIDNEEMLEGMVALAVPVRDQSGAYVASLAFHGPAQRLSVDGMLGHLETLKSASEKITRLLY